VKLVPAATFRSTIFRYVHSYSSFFHVFFLIPFILLFRNSCHANFLSGYVPTNYLEIHTAVTPLPTPPQYPPQPQHQQPQQQQEPLQSLPDTIASQPASQPGASFTSQAGYPPVVVGYQQPSQQPTQNVPATIATVAAATVDYSAPVYHQSALGMPSVIAGYAQPSSSASFASSSSVGLAGTDAVLAVLAQAAQVSYLGPTWLVALCFCI
jgi:hypothetical protein